MVVKKLLLACWIVLFGVVGHAQNSSSSLTKNLDSIPEVSILSEYRPATSLQGKYTFSPTFLSQSKVIDTLRLRYTIRPSFLAIPHNAEQLYALAYDVVKKPEPYDNYVSLYTSNTHMPIPQMRLALGMGNRKNADFLLYASHTAEKAGDIFSYRAQPYQQYRRIYGGLFGKIEGKTLSWKTGLQTKYFTYAKYGTQVFSERVRKLIGYQSNVFEQYEVYANADSKQTDKVLLRFNSSVQLNMLRDFWAEQRVGLSMYATSASHHDASVFYQFGLGYVGNFLHSTVKLSPQVIAAGGRIPAQQNQFLYAQSRVSYEGEKAGVRLRMNAMFFPRPLRHAPKNLSLANQMVYILPAVSAYYNINGANADVLRVHAGWRETIDENNLAHLFTQNPWIQGESVQYFNTHTSHWFIGLDGGLKHLWDYSLRLSYDIEQNLPIFMNAFNLPYEFSVDGKNIFSSVGVYAYLAYHYVDKIKLSVELINHNYSLSRNASAPYGLRPVVLNATVEFLNIWNFLDIRMTSKLMQGSRFLVNIPDGRLLPSGRPYVDGSSLVLDRNSYAMTSVFWDVSASVLAHITKKVSVFGRVDNALNRENPLWFYYASMPFSAGVGLNIYFHTYPVAKRGRVPQRR